MIVPYLFTVWALKHDSDLLVNISEADNNLYTDKIIALKFHSLASHVDSAWDSVPYEASKLMIHMWSTHPAGHTKIAHPIPTVEEAQDLVQLDPWLMPTGWTLAITLIPNAVNTNSDPLFLSSI